MRKVMWKNGKRIEYEEFVFDPHAVNRGLEILGREVGLFAETYKLHGDVRFSRMSNEELDAFIREKLEEIKRIEGTSGPVGGDSGGA